MVPYPILVAILGAYLGIFWYKSRVHICSHKDMLIVEITVLRNLEFTFIPNVSLENQQKYQ
jgi:uncharacterized membrane protein YqiK